MNVSSGGQIFENDFNDTAGQQGQIASPDQQASDTGQENQKTFEVECVIVQYGTTSKAADLEYESLQREKEENPENITKDIIEALLQGKNEISDITEQLKSLYSKLETDKKELETKHEELKQTCIDIDKEKHTLEGLNTTLESEVLLLRHDTASLQQREIQLENYYKQQLEARSSIIENQAQQIKQLHEEKECLLNRLSKIAGDRHTHENVNIADLSDADRPTKLSEVYSELYDNEWTDAFEELTGKRLFSDEKAIECLLEMLLNAFQKCREITWNRYEAMKSVAITLDIMHGISSTSQNKSQERKVVLNPEESKSAQSPKDPEQVKQPSSSPSEEEVTAKQVPESNHDNTLMGTDQKNGTQITPQVLESNHESSLASGLEDLNQVYTMDVSRPSSTTTSGQSCSKDKKTADVAEEDEKDPRAQATLHLSLSVHQEKEIKTAWKQMTNAIKTQALELLRSILITGLEINDTDMPNVSRYLMSCVEICWKMGVQEKPLHLDIGAERDDCPDRIFDADKFRAYTKTGKKVAYVVWPALFLHEGGPMLTKGIAQGC